MQSPWLSSQDRPHGKLRMMKVAGTQKVFEDTQAGSGGILVDQNNNVTYYEQYFDPTFATFTQACQLANKNCQQTPAAQALKLPVGSTEIKAAWRPISPSDPDFKSYYTIQNAVVPDPTTSQCKVVPYMGLVGFHLVFATQNHQELVWATFEHVANAPNGPCTTGGSYAPPKGLQWAYFNNSQPANCAQVNVWNKPAQGQPPPISQVMLNHPYGDDGSAQNTGTPYTNVQLIQAINQSVQKLLPANSVWRNYFLLGAVWTNGGVLPAYNNYTSPGQGNELGSTVLANSTMESFVQLPNPAPNPVPSHQVVNCFTCHNTLNSKGQQQPWFSVSHAFFNASSAAECSYSTQLPAACQQLESQLATKPAPARSVVPVKGQGKEKAPRGKGSSSSM